VNVRRLDGVGGLRPGAPVLNATAGLPIAVPYHSIMPLLGPPDSLLATDLAVRYSSSHIEGAESELIYPGIHDQTDTPQVASEIRRILLEHLAAGCGPVTTPVPATCANGVERHESAGFRHIRGGF
jgi:hypothetical protein